MNYHKFKLKINRNQIDIVRICSHGFKVNLSRAFAGQEVGIKEMEDNIWVVSFLDYDLGYFDDKSHKVEPVDDPFGLT